MVVFLTVVGAVLLGLIVVVIYLNDRVNELERRTSSAPGGGSGGGGGDDNTWHGLSGKRLWDAMTGKKGVTKLDETALTELRQAYELVLAKHIESLFQAGQADARKGQNNQPSSVKTVSSPRGQVQSWIPLNHANAIYRAGADSTKTDLFEVERARMALDEAAQILFGQVNLPLSQLFSEVLMPLEPDPAEPPAALAGSGPGSMAAPSGAGFASPTPSATAPADATPPASLGAPSSGGLSGGLFSAPDSSRTPTGVPTAKS